MRAGIHPEYRTIHVKCSCGNEFDTGSTLESDKGALNIEVCSECHPFYTGKHKIVDAAGRVESFNKRFAKLGEPRPETPAKKGKK